MLIANFALALLLGNSDTFMTYVGIICFALGTVIVLFLALGRIRNALKLKAQEKKKRDRIKQQKNMQIENSNQDGMKLKKNHDFIPSTENAVFDSAPDIMSPDYIRNVSETKVEVKPNNSVESLKSSQFNGVGANVNNSNGLNRIDSSKPTGISPLQNQVQNQRSTSTIPMPGSNVTNNQLSQLNNTQNSIMEKTQQIIDKADEANRKIVEQQKLQNSKSSMGQQVRDTSNNSDNIASVNVNSNKVAANFFNAPPAAPGILNSTIVPGGQTLNLAGTVKDNKNVESNVVITSDIKDFVNKTRQEAEQEQRGKLQNEDVHGNVKNENELKKEDSSKTTMKTDEKLTTKVLENGKADKEFVTQKTESSNKMPEDLKKKIQQEIQKTLNNSSKENSAKVNSSDSSVEKNRKLEMPKDVVTTKNVKDVKEEVRLVESKSNDKLTDFGKNEIKKETLKVVNKEVKDDNKKNTESANDNKLEKDDFVKSDESLLYTEGKKVSLSSMALQSSKSNNNAMMAKNNFEKIEKHKVENSNSSLNLKLDQSIEDEKKSQNVGKVNFKSSMFEADNYEKEDLKALDVKDGDGAKINDLATSEKSNKDLKLENKKIEKIVLVSETNAEADIENSREESNLKKPTQNNYEEYKKLLKEKEQNREKEALDIIQNLFTDITPDEIDGTVEEKNEKVKVSEEVKQKDKQEAKALEKIKNDINIAKNVEIKKQDTIIDINASVEALEEKTVLNAGISIRGISNYRKVIAVISPENCGKTTLAVNLAYEYANRGISTTLIDTDNVKKDIYFQVKTDKIGCLSRFGEFDTDDELYDLAIRPRENLAVFTENIGVDFEINYPKLYRVINYAHEKDDVVIIDIKRGLGQEKVKELLRLSTNVLLVIDKKVSTMYRIADTLFKIRGAFLNKNIDLVVNMDVGQRGVTKSTIKAMFKKLEYFEGDKKKYYSIDINDILFVQYDFKSIVYGLQQGLPAITVKENKLIGDIRKLALRYFE